MFACWLFLRLLGGLFGAALCSIGWPFGADFGWPFGADFGWPFGADFGWPFGADFGWQRDGMG
jgi:hypothetical protein